MKQFKDSNEARDIKVKQSPTVPAVEQASRILFCLSTGPAFRMRLTDICKHAGVYKSTGYSILATLEKYGLVQRDPKDKTYSLGTGLISLSRKVLDNLNYSELVGPSLESLAQSTQSTAIFGLISDKSLYVVAKREIEKKISVTIGLGHRFPVLWGAHGKAIVAFMDDSRKTRILAGKKLYFHGDPGNFDRDVFQKELADAKNDGYALDLGQMNTGINAVASPVFGAGTNPIGAVFIIGTFSEAFVPDCGPIVAEKAVEISRLFGADTETIFQFHVTGTKGYKYA